MRKRIIRDTEQQFSSPDEHWLALENVAQVEVTSEDATHPVESALAGAKDGSWRAGEPGEQTIRLVFDRPQEVTRIRLVFEEHEFERTQEFVLRWSPESRKPFREIVHQQWNFSPSGATKEVEDYRVELHGVALLELNIIPDKRGGEARATLKELRIA
jgi:hypothetical protein